MLLLDTQIVLWLAKEEQAKFSRKAEMAMAVAANDGFAIAAITLWEIALLEAEDRMGFVVSVDDFLDELERTYIVLPLDRKIAVLGANFSKRYPKDPADRQIGATALIHDMQMVTSDEKIRKSGEVPCIW